MDCKETITFSWYTGSITVYKELLLNESAAYLKKLLNTADKNREEVSEELKNYIQDEIAALDPKSAIDKKRIEKYNKLLSVFAERKQTKEEKANDRIPAPLVAPFKGKAKHRAKKHKNREYGFQY